jgi:hypothetical protein
MVGSDPQRFLWRKLVPAVGAGNPTSECQGNMRRRHGAFAKNEWSGFFFRTPTNCFVQVRGTRSEGLCAENPKIPPHRPQSGPIEAAKPVNWGSYRPCKQPSSLGI